MEHRALQLAIRPNFLGKKFQGLIQISHASTRPKSLDYAFSFSIYFVFFFFFCVFVEILKVESEEVKEWEK